MSLGAKGQESPSKMGELLKILLTGPRGGKIRGVASARRSQVAIAMFSACRTYWIGLMIVVLSDPAKRRPITKSS